MKTLISGGLPFLSYLIVVLTVLTGTVCFTYETTNNYILQLLLLLLSFCVSVCLFVFFNIV